jgi:uncharacterized protein YdeI (YjbR/CyaY-like superfamily)
VFKDHVKLNFFKGALLPDPKKLFNAGLDAKATRAIDIHENDKIDETALKELVRAAVALNAAGKKKKMKQDTSDLPKLAAPARRALTSAGITNLKDLTKVSEDELMQLHGMGKNAVRILRDAELV